MFVSRLQLKQFFNSKADIMAWVVLTIAIGGRVSESLGDWPFVAMVGLCLVTMLGTQHFEGVEAGPGGWKVSRGPEGDE
jgi:hypothetical protein